jgi:hypothetical protein
MVNRAEGERRVAMNRFLPTKSRDAVWGWRWFTALSKTTAATFPLSEVGHATVFKVYLPAT